MLRIRLGGWHQDSLSFAVCMIPRSALLTVDMRESAD